jgi:hypothetical protein
VVKYEDLLERPEQELGGIQRFLGLAEPFQSDMLRSGHSQQYEERWTSMSEGVLGRVTRRRIESDYAEMAAHFGYDISDLSVRTPWSLTH